MIDSVPSSDDFVAALKAVPKLTDTQVQMLRTHYQSPSHTITATELSMEMGYTHHSYANGQYGRLGRIVGEQIQFNPDHDRVGTLVLFEKRQGEWHWIMRPELVVALEKLGWVEGDGVLLPEELEAAVHLTEGAASRVLVNAYERNARARRMCIQHHGHTCFICGFDFGHTYGEVADGYIHVHHLKPLSTIASAYTVDPIDDLRPVCPNCHAVLHRRIPAFSIEEVRAMLRRPGNA